MLRFKIRICTAIIALAGLTGVSVTRAQDASRIENTVNYLERLITDHRDGVRAVAVLPDGKRFVSASNDHTARLWELSTGKLLHTFEGHTGPVRCVAVSRDGSRIATGSEDSSVIVWDVTTGKIISHLTGHGHTVIGVAFLPDGRLSSIGGEGLRVWDLDTEKTVVKGASNIGGYPFRAAYSADGTRAAILDSFGPSALWDTKTCKVIEEMPGGKFDTLLAIGLSPDGNTVIYPDAKGSAVYDVRTKVSTLIKGGIGPESIAFSPDGKRVVVSAGSFAHVWSLNPPKQETTLGSNSQISMVHGVAFTPDGRHVLAGIGGNEAPTWTPNPPNGIAIFDLDRRKTAVVTGPPTGEISWELIPAKVKTHSGELVGVQQYFDEEKNVPLHLSPAGKDWDIVWSVTKVLVHRRAGELQQIYQKDGGQVSDVKWDGKYIWIYSWRDGLDVCDEAGKIIAGSTEEDALPNGQSNAGSMVLLGQGKVLMSGWGGLTPGVQERTGWVTVVEMTPGSKSPQYINSLKYTKIVDDAKKLVPDGWTAKPHGRVGQDAFSPQQTYLYRDEIWLMCNGTSQAPTPIVRIDRKTLTAKTYNVTQNGKPIRRDVVGATLQPIYTYADGRILAFTGQYKALTVGPESIYDAPQVVLSPPPQTRSFDPVILGDHIAVPGSSWLRFDLATSSGRVAGPGLQAGGHPIDSGVEYTISAHFGLCGISMVDGGFYKISDDPNKPLANRPIALKPEQR